MKIFKNYIVLFCLAVLHIPVVLQTMHLFENHEHLICTSEIEQHFHEHEDMDCSQFHYQFKMYSLDLKDTFNALPTHFFTNQYNEQPRGICAVLYTKQYDRGPPIG